MFTSTQDMAALLPDVLDFIGGLLGGLLGGLGS